jgi:GcrA cell cycle regulator
VTNQEARDRPVSRDEAAMRDQWTAERVALLKQLWARGISAGKIAAQLGGVSRSAVAGKIYRLRRRQADEPPQPASPPSGKSLLELTNSCCRWVVEAAIKWLVTAILSHFQ